MSVTPGRSTQARGRVRVEHAFTVSAGGKEVAGAALRYEQSPFEDLRDAIRKGQAEYWSLRVGDEDLRDVAWSYRSPFSESQKIARLISFYPEKVDPYVDGVLQT